MEGISLNLAVFRAIALACLGLVILTRPALAEIAAIPMPGDTRLVVFPYGKDDTYTILTRPGAVTDIQLYPDEEVQMLAMGESVQWEAAQTPGHVLIKPKVPGIFTSATLVTTKRTYQLTFRSSPMDGKWYQMVRWDHPEIIVFQQLQEKKQQDTEAKFNKAETLTDDGTDIDKFNFNYRITGEVGFKPLQVMDNGKFTWVRMPPNIPELPAVFAIGADDKAEMVNFTVKRDYIIVHRVAKGILLKIGKDEVRITHETESSFFSFWRSK